MAKILTDHEMADIICRATHDECVIDDADSYQHFLEDLGDLICTHFGGERGSIGNPDLPGGELGWTCAFRINECVPDNGGIFNDYDKDVVWEDGEELTAYSSDLDGAEVGKTLYVPVRGPEVVDAFERQLEYTQMSGERQILVDTEAFSATKFDEAIEDLAKKILERAVEEEASHIDIYC